VILEFYIFKQVFVCCMFEGTRPIDYGNSKRNVSFQLLLNSRRAVLLLKLPWMIAVSGKL
jgi:hypothetical protein